MQHKESVMPSLARLEKTIFRTSALIAKQMKIVDWLDQKGLDRAGALVLLAELRSTRANLVESHRLLGIPTSIPKLMSARTGADAIGWRSIETVPFGRDLQLAVLSSARVDALVFPCRRVLRGWLNSETHAAVQVYPTHWREWDDGLNPLLATVAS